MSACNKKRNRTTDVESTLMVNQEAEGIGKEQNRVKG